MKLFHTYLAIFVLLLSCAHAKAEQPENANTPGSKLRIVALAPHIVESLYDIGAGDYIVGTVDYADYPAAANDIPRIGGYYGIQIEKVLALKPDLIIAWKNGNKAADLAQLERLGVPISYSDPKDLLGVAQELRLFGSLTGKEQKAEAVAQLFEQRLQQLRTKYQQKAPISVFYQLWSEPMMTVNKNTWIHQLMDVCSASNVFADNATDYPQISVENVVITKPQVIIIPDEKSDKPQPTIDWHKWPEIPAVKQQQFIHVNADLLHRFSIRMLDGVADMCSKIEQSRTRYLTVQ